MVEDTSKRTYVETKRAIQRLKAQQLSVKKIQAEIEQNYENVYKEKREGLLSLKHNIRQALLRNLNPQKKSSTAGSAYSTRSRQRQMYLESAMATEVSHEQVMKYLVQYREALKERETKSNKAAQYMRLAKRHTSSTLSLQHHKGSSNSGMMKKQREGGFPLSKRIKKLGGDTDVRMHEPNPLLLPRKYAQASEDVYGKSSEETTTSTTEPAKDLAKLDSKRMKAMDILKKTSRVTPWAVDPSSFTQPQIVCGKKYMGETTFLSRPRGISFRDFELGQTYEKKVELTNVSWTINRFKRVVVDEALDDIVNVTCDFPGLMSAGMMCNMVVTFQPKVLQDLTGFITILAETGPVAIPFECTTKKAETSVSCESITLTPVMIGEQSTSQMEITNLGAIPVTWDLTVLDILSVDENTGETAGVLYSAGKEGGGGADEAEDILSDLGLSFTNIGKIPEYSRCKNKFVFSPVKDIKIVVKANYVFKTKTGEYLPPIPLEITAQAQRLPLAAVDKVVDFKCCKYKSIYQNTMKVQNSGKTALKCCIVQRPELKPYIEFLPDIGYCQAGRAFTFTISFNPTQEIEKDCERWIDKETGILQVPFKIHAPAQPTPVGFTFRARLTSSDLVFEPEILDFGKCVADMPTGLKLRVTNKGMLPARLAMRASKFGKEGSFLASTNRGQKSKGPEQAVVSFEPNDGFNAILPNGTIELTVCFCGSTEATHAFQVYCFALGETGQPCKFSIPCKAEVVHIPLKFSTFHLSLPPTAFKPGSISQASVVLRNSSGLSSCDYQFKSPSSDLTFSPLVGSIPPKGTCRVVVKFEPCQVEQSSAPKEGEEPEEGKEAQEKESAKSPNPPPEDMINKLRSLWSPCVVKYEGDLSLVHLNVQTYVVKPNLTLFAPGMKVRESGICELGFGTVAIGERHILTLRLSAEEVEEVLPVSYSMLDHKGDFQILNAVRPIKKNKDCVLQLCFAPRETREYFEKLTLSTKFESIRINLLGEGVLPSMSLVDDQSPIDMGFTVPKDIKESAFALKYVSKCPVRYQLCVEEENFNSNFGPSVFSCHPSSGVVELEGELEVNVRFKPQFKQESFMKARVVVKCQEDELGSVNVEGRCLAAGIHIQYPQGKLLSNTDAFTSSLKSCIAAAEDGDTEAEKEEAEPFYLRFDESIMLGQKREEFFEIVNTGKTSGEFSFDAQSDDDIVQERWQVTPAKGQVAAGSSVKISVSLEMPVDISPEFVVYFGLESWIEGQWNCTISTGNSTTKVPFMSACLVKPMKMPEEAEEA
ncbi:hypothetical protein HOP50_15g75240 [Chloropicon primus]|uniref:CFAP74 third Ig-like domain-containing protein n=1 Tax=Chloropicon primus TaxID=1764295 RepID=A0A5B8MXB8_9CHLO|nr:hypothetical protein A3770_15p74990 [Chloropicon primus]UPR04190.1 hypothetical protein HOP50_15g75240 [Chloropicon primus]|eukprot:QDZ24981.1 hypothetical protein A3770_15p74990 [Chloropicon primus]